VKITADTKITGQLSEVPRQIDILIEGNVSGIADVAIALDCKCFSRKVDVKNVEAFLGMVKTSGSTWACSSPPSASRQRPSVAQQRSCRK
jgi:hypothetical protein